jgi:hypothetical protein
MAQPKSSCHSDGCQDDKSRWGSGAFMPRGTGRTKGLLGQKGNLYECMKCHTVHVFNDRGEFLGFAK